MPIWLRRFTFETLKEHYEQQAKDWVWFGAGGKPIFTFFPSDINDLATFCKNVPSEIKFRTLGAGSNILVNDNGYNGIFIRLQRGFRNLEFQNNQIIADAGLPGAYIVEKACEQNMGGISFLATIPGRLGGLIAMNAGAHGKEMKDIMALKAEGVECEECQHKFTLEIAMDQTNFFVVGS
jgi:UDP-N-acetylmuramate dehydrogenase